MSREDLHFRLRIAPDIKAWIAAQAARNLRSITAEINFALRERMAATGDSFAGTAPAAASDRTALAGGSIHQRS
jgi:hypothetical protein